MMDALIVPFAAVGMAESLTTIADGGLLSLSLSMHSLLQTMN